MENNEINNQENFGYRSNTNPSKFEVVSDSFSKNNFNNYSRNSSKENKPSVRRW